MHWMVVREPFFPLFNFYLKGEVDTTDPFFVAVVVL